MTKAPDWSANEDRIIREQCPSEARRLLSIRTWGAIKRRRQQIGVTTTQPRWSKTEDRILKKYAPRETIRKLAKRLKNRSIEAIKSRRSAVCPTTKVRNWTGVELKRLERLWPVSSQEEIEAAFPSRTWNALFKRARLIHLTRPIELADTGSEYKNEIRQRAREDCVSIKQLCVQSGVEVHFLTSKKSKGAADMNKVDKCVRFFGGKLVIDWQDE